MIAVVDRHRANAASTVRLVGEFGSFTGRIARWDRDSLEGFSADPDWGGTSPAAAVGWSQVERLDKRVSNARRGAVVGALALGSLTALFAAIASSLAHIELAPFDTHDPKVGGAALVGAAIGGTVGAGLGGWDGRYGWLHLVTIARDHRRMGLGTQVVRRIESGLEATGCRHLRVVDEGDPADLAFWETIGYRRDEGGYLAPELVSSRPGPDEADGPADPSPE